MYRKSIRSLDNKIYKINNVYIGNISKGKSLYETAGNDLVGENKNLIIYNQNNSELIIGNNATITRDNENLVYNVNDGESQIIYDIEYHIGIDDKFSHLKIDNGDLYYYVIEDLQGNKDQDFLDFSYNHLLSMNDLCFIPRDRQIGIYNLDTDRKVGIISVDFPDKYKTSELLYRVGLISDVHYNDKDKSDTSPDTYINDTDIGEYGSMYYEDLKNVLEFFKTKNIKFISCSGDITTDARKHSNNYKYCIDTYSNHSIFTCTGNHDTAVKAYEIAENGPVLGNYEYKYTDIDIIQKNTNFTIHRITEEYPNDDDGTSYWFTYNNDVYIYLNVNYGKSYKYGEDSISKENDWGTHKPKMLTEEEIINLYPNEKKYIVNSVWNSSTNSWDKYYILDTTNCYHLYTHTTLEWLSNLLERFKNQRCFIFTHLMWREGAGNYKGDIGYYEYFEGDTRKDTLHGVQGEYLRKLRDKYSNNIWFSGHSHYEWIWQVIDDKINIAKHNNSYTFHIPSLARPLKINNTRYKDDYNHVLNIENSEFGIMDVYNDHIEFHGYVGYDKTGCYGNLTNNRLMSYYFPDIQLNNITNNNFSNTVYYTRDDYYNKTGGGYWQIEEKSDAIVNYITSGKWKDYIRIQCKNYNYITFSPNNPNNYNSIDIKFEDVKIFPYYINSPNYSEDFNVINRDLDLNDKGLFGIYYNGTYYTPQTDRSMFSGINVNKMFLRLKDLSQISDFSHLDFRNNGDNSNSFIRNNGVTIYIKLKYRYYQLNEDEKQKTHYYNKITPVANFRIDLQNNTI